ncbi:pyruvate kinase [Methanococcoides vulcani]|uniref:Pyruvate kinase n=1 Tax=Methanococcoides vulcani TaxID=1353158 RepID=A0A1H9ZRK5_9EURY|nr:pyruvate kinase [Methanococcoides vulcani]
MSFLKLPDHKTKIVCTIGPASSSEEVLRELILNGMNVARINFSHGSFESHGKVIRTIKKLCKELDVVVSIMADLPGPKIRVGQLQDEPLNLQKGDKVKLTTDKIVGSGDLIPVDFDKLPYCIAKTSDVYFNDGFIQMRCNGVCSNEAECEVVVGGLLSSHKGVNLPGTDLLLDPVTERDLEIVDFVLDEGVNCFSVSFIVRGTDIQKVRDHAAKKGRSVFLVAKIERSQTLNNIDDIMDVTDGLMVARGDLGVEIPIEEVPIVQKELIHKANLRGIPVITATHMLESMTENIRPTRAEATDVANAILDGTDAVMLSGETAVGKYPVETVKTMVNIAKKTEMWRTSTGFGLDLIRKGIDETTMNISDVVSVQVHEAIKRLPIKYVVIPTYSGGTPRRISRFKPDEWIIAMSHLDMTCEQLAYSYGVYPVKVTDGSESIEQKANESLRSKGIGDPGDMIVLTQGHTGGTNLLKIIELT